MDAELWTRLRLSLQRAMWESVTSDLRGVAIALDDAERPAFRVRFLYASAVGDLQEELVSLVETYLVSDFNEVPDSLTTSFSVIPTPRGSWGKASTGSSCAGNPKRNRA